MKLRVAIVEDDRVAAQELENCLERYETGRNVSFSIVHFPDGGLFLRQYQPVYDIVFMDIKMPGMDGMTAAQKLRQIDPVTTLVFVTSVVQYAVKGYEVDAIDFIVKPVRYHTFALKMRRIMEAVRLKQGCGILVNAEGGSRVIPSSQVYYVEVTSHILTYHTEQGDFEMRGKLSSVEQQLPADSFFRCSVSHLINLRYLTQLGSESVVVAGQEIRFSRAKKKELTAAVAAYLGKGV